MKIIDKIEKAQKENAIGYSFEYFPPKTELVNMSSEKKEQGV
jgi:methylenetetrahydrofolate reductase (NADPH)